MKRLAIVLTILCLLFGSCNRKPVDEFPLISSPGDINCNGVAYEIADAVMFSNFFITGPAAFGPTALDHQDASIAASDCNFDGIALSVSDYVYLVRAVVGDAVPYAKVRTITANYYFRYGIMNVDAPMGAAFIVADAPATALNGVQVKQGFVDGKHHILATGYDANANTYCSFRGDFLQINGNIISVEFAAADGSMVNISVEDPNRFRVFQNYPNPFTSTTKITFNNPCNCPWKVTIYNTAGKRVDKFSGDNCTRVSFDWDASHLPNGVYLYKVEAGGKEITMKATLHK